MSCQPGTYLLSSNYSCVACNVDSYFISGVECLQCDSICLTCDGGLPTNCITCAASKYLVPSNRSCVACNVNGYFISDNDECLECDPICLTCNGALSTNCLSCQPGTYLFSSNHSCVACNVDGYFISGTECLQCDSTCLNCNGASTSSCLSCKTGRYLQNSTCLLFDNEFISTTGKVAEITSQIQYVASTVMPMMLAERSTSAIILVGFLADVGLYKYLNVPFPENFVSFCEEMESFDPPNIFENMDSGNRGNNPTSIIGKFQFWEVSATLLDNCSFAIAKELITLAIILGLNILVFLLKGFTRLSDVLRKVRTLFMWNVFLSYYLGDFPDLLLHSMIQLRENYVSSAYTNFSFALAVIIVSTYAVLAIYFRYLLNKKHPQWQKTAERRHSISTTKNTEKWEKVPDSLEILVEDFRENKTFARNFILVMLLETFLQILVIFFFQDNGLTQAILYIIIVLGFFLLSAWKRPYKSSLHQAILLLNQGSKLVMGIIAAVFGINDKLQCISEELTNLMGLILMLLILIVMIINLAISLLMIIISSYEKIKEWRSRRRGNHSNLSARNIEINAQKQNFVEEQSPSSKFEQSSLDLHADSNVQANQLDQNSNERRFRVRSNSKQSLQLSKVHRVNDIKRYHIGNDSISEIRMTESAQ